jgi:phosphoenolpyruvate---glycerone phosphotransferase subunit DhaK
MNSFINEPEEYVSEILEGIILAHPEYELVPGFQRSLKWKASPISNKVAIVTGGGSGHLPLFLGFVGDGLCDGVAVGNVFSSPSSTSVAEVARSVHGGRGVLFVIGNYFGDQMNFEEAAELLQDEGIEAQVVRVTDDIASAPTEMLDDRRGIAGLALIYKILGAAAKAGRPLTELVQLFEKVNQHVKTIGVTLSGCTLPGANQPVFSVPDGSVAVGMGIHGEPGIEIAPMTSADELTKSIVQKLFVEVDPDNKSLAVLINSLGGTPLEELYIIHRSLVHSLPDSFEIKKALVGRFACSLEAKGFSLSLLPLQDDWHELLNAPSYSPFLNYQVRG